MALDVETFFREEAATSTTEYAIIISLVASALILASDGVRSATTPKFHHLAICLQESSIGQGAGRNAPHTSLAENGSPQPFSSTAIAPLQHGLAWSVLFIAVGMVGYSRYRQIRARLALQELICGPEPNLEDPRHPTFAKRQEILLLLLRHFDNPLESRIEVRHVMSRKVRAVVPETPLHDVRTLMDSERFHHLLVMQQDTLVGVISDRDVHRRHGRRAQDVMTKDMLTVALHTQIGQAVTTIINHRISCLPVVENGKVHGIFTTTDISMTLQCLLHLVERWQVDPQKSA